ncbi:MAG: DUF2982 domain-containing protein [Scytonematopsis contorta HA4267-MV1]|jgi:hypothetical protein|nr:DUF2982 domain-containing protein [Scytonematopsis contorta HA4267-MV1]
MNPAGSFDVKPNAIRSIKKVILPFVFYIAFAVLSCFVIQSGGFLGTLFGIMSLICSISAITILIFIASLKHPASMVLTPEGIQRSAFGNYLICWQDIKNIEVANMEMRKYVGVQLKPDAINYLPINVQKSISFNKSYFGYDILLSELELDRPVNKFIILLEQYRQ